MALSPSDPLLADCDVIVVGSQKEFRKLDHSPVLAFVGDENERPYLVVNQAAGAVAVVR